VVSQARCQVFLKELKGVTLDLPRQRAIVEDPRDDDMRLVLLKEAVVDRQGLTLVHFSAQLERFVWDRGCA